MITGKNYIGNDLSGIGNKFHKTINAKLNVENSINFIDATSKEINQAVTLAHKAFQVYKNISGKEKASFLNCISDQILALGDELIEIFILESGFSEGRALGERSRTVSQLQAFAKMIQTDDWKNNIIEKSLPNRKPSPKPDIRKSYIPIGPIAVFTPSNFPLAYSSAGGDTSSALASGCSVVVKAHYMHSGTAELVSSAIIKSVKKTGMPNGVFSNINGGIEVGQDLVKNLKIKGVGFTGSKSGGRSIYNIGSQREEPIPVFSEMGSINPVIISSKSIDSRYKEIANILSESITLGAGQFCTNPGLIIVIDNESTMNFIDNLVNNVIKKGSQCMIHQNIKESFLNNLEFISKQKGMKVLAKTDSGLTGNYVSSQINSVFAKFFLVNSKMHQEIFGPFSLIVKCKNEDELIKVINSLEGQLTGSLFTEKEEFKEFYSVIDALKSKVGRIIYNSVPTGVEVSQAMTHGGPYPASSDSRYTSVGLDSIKRWVRPITYQDWPFDSLPSDLRE
jgi:NADP-dependent aldehyde dehydrogenase